MAAAFDPWTVAWSVALGAAAGAGGVWWLGRLRLRRLEADLRRREEEVVAQARQMESTREGERAFLADAPVALWQEDFSDVGRWCATLRARGVEDLRAYFSAHPAELREAIGQVRVERYNRAAQDLAEATDPREMERRTVEIFRSLPIDIVAEKVSTLAGGAPSWSRSVSLTTLRQGTRTIWVAAVAVGSSTQPPGRILSSVVDLTTVQRQWGRTALIRRMRAATAMLSSLTHEVSNLLTPVLLELDFLGQTRGLPPEVSARLQRLSQLAQERIENSRRLFGSYRSRPGGVAAGDLGELVREAVAAARERVDRRVSIELTPQAERLEVVLDRTATLEAISTLVVQAGRAAAERTGSQAPLVEVSLSREAEGAAGAAGVDASVRHWACLTVVDNGPRHDEAGLECYFDPYWVGEEGERRSNLPLTRAWQTLDAAGAWLELNGTLGQGARLGVHFPLLTGRS